MLTQSLTDQFTQANEESKEDTLSPWTQSREWCDPDLEGTYLGFNLILSIYSFGVLILYMHIMQI